MLEWIFLALGLYLIVGVVIFGLGMNGRKAQRMINFVGVAGAKIVYALIGVVFIATAVASWIGVISLS